MGLVKPIRASVKIFVQSILRIFMHAMEQSCNSLDVDL